MKNEKGFSLIEVMIAIALLGIIGVAFLGALATASTALSIADERATAESLARSQMEDIKEQPYIYYDVAEHEDYDPIPAPSDYTIEVTAVPFDPDTGVPYSKTGGVFDHDEGIQKITVTVRHLEKPDAIITLVGYKVDR